MQLSAFVLISLVAGILGAAAMEIVMWLITREGWAKGNMIVAVGSLFTHSKKNALGLGLALHCASAFIFAAVYVFAMAKLGLSHLPTSFESGIGFGIIHGLVVSLMLVWVVAERHPLEEFREAGLAVGISHFAGHVAFGGIVGLVVGLAHI